MASGTEMLMNALLKAAGFNPKEFAEGINNFVGGVNSKLTEFDARLTNVETLLLSINETVSRIADQTSLRDAPVAPLTFREQETAMVSEGVVHYLEKSKLQEISEHTENGDTTATVDGANGPRASAAGGGFNKLE
jgi:hypothetical protein